MKAALLLRCSTDSQDYQRQYDDLMRQAERFGYEVPESLIFGEYITGRDDVTRGNRKSIEKLLKAAESGKMDVILINEVSRLSRDSVSGRVYVRQLNNIGIPVYFRDKNRWTIDLNTKKVDDGFERQLGTYFDGAAEYLRSLMSQTASGRRNRLRNNQMIQGRPAFGYKKLRSADRHTANTLVLDPDTKDIVVEIYNKYLEDKATLKTVATYIRAKYELPFTVGKTYHCLTYTGYYSGKTTVTTKDPDRPDDPPEVFTITMPTIIEQDVFERVQKKLKANKNEGSPQPTKLQIRLLSRLIKCPSCGHSFTPFKRSDRMGYFWKCMSKINLAADCPSDVHLGEDKLVTAVWYIVSNEIITLINLNENERKLRIEQEETKISSYSEEIDLLIPQIKFLDRKIGRAYDLYLDASDDLVETAKERFNKTQQEIAKEKEDIQIRIDNLTKEISLCNYNIQRYSKTDFAADFFQEMEDNPDKKREVLLEYVKVIYPYKIRYSHYVIEVHTVEGIYYVLIKGHSKKRIAYYIHYSFAIFQNGTRYNSIYGNKGDYFVIPNASMVMETDELEEFVSFDDMIPICEKNNWIIEY